MGQCKVIKASRKWWDSVKSLRQAGSGGTAGDKENVRYQFHRHSSFTISWLQL